MDIFKDAFKAYWEAEVAEGKELYGYPVPVAVAYAGFMFITFLLARIVSPLVARGYSNLKSQAKTDWCNRFAAIVHAVIMSILTFRYWLVVNPQWKIDMELNPYEKLALNLMTGYMVYDLIVELVTPAVWDMAVLFHHVAGLISHVCTLIYGDGLSAFYTMMVYCAESSTPFLHLGWMQHTLKMDGSMIFIVTSVTCVLLFFIFRVVLSPYLLYLFWTNRALYGDRHAMFTFQLGICVAFFSLNYFWFNKLVSVIFHGPPKPKKTN